MSFAKNKKDMNYYHICTKGTKDRVLFKDNDDYISAMNYVAISCIEHDITLLAFCIMSNHLHFIVWSDYTNAKKFIISIKRRCSLKHWHKYNEYLHEYHREKCPQIPFEKFASEVEGVRDADEISKWVEQMKVRTVYKLKEPGEGENSIFETREAAMNHVAHKWGAELVKKYDQVRFKGANLARLPFGRIRKNIEEAWHKQKRFPIVTANNLRGRLRRTGFAVYKRGTKGFAFVSAIKRKFLFEGDSLAEAPQKIFDFISANPGILADQLPYKFLGMEAPKSESKPKPLSEEAGSDNIENTGEPPSHPEELSDETKAKLAAVWRELAWLISEGYVVEYADASLQANPYLGGDSSLSCSPETAAVIDDMVVDTVKNAYDKAMTLLKDNQGKLHELAKFLYEKETITGEEFMGILTQKALPEEENPEDMADRSEISEDQNNDN